MPNFERLSTTGEATAPLLVHIPHSSTSIPDHYRGQFQLSEPDLKRELLAMTDRYTRELFAKYAINNGGSVFVNRLSRLLFDPEGFEDDEVCGRPTAHIRGTARTHLVRGDVVVGACRNFICREF